jgi:hypothetical protein
MVVSYESSSRAVGAVTEVEWMGVCGVREDNKASRMTGQATVTLNMQNHQMWRAAEKGKKEREVDF